MSLTASSRRNDYIGNNSASSFPFTFKITDEANLKVSVVDADGEHSSLVLATDYTVDGVGASSGSITLVDNDQDYLSVSGNLATGFSLSILGDTPLVQNTSIKNQGTYYARVHEDVFDKLMAIDQEQKNQIDRSVKLSPTDDPLDFDTNLPGFTADSAGRFLAVNLDGDGFYFGPTEAGLNALVADAGASAANATAAQAAAEDAQAAAETAQAAADAAVISATASQDSAEDSAAAAAASYDDIAALIGSVLTQSDHTFTDNQAATDLTGETLDGSTYISCKVEVAILRGVGYTAGVDANIDIFFQKTLIIQYKNAAWRIVSANEFSIEDEHGLTFSVSQAGMVGQLRLASDNTGLGPGKIFIKKTFIAKVS